MYRGHELTQGVSEDGNVLTQMYHGRARRFAFVRCPVALGPELWCSDDHEKSGTERNLSLPGSWTEKEILRFQLFSIELR